MASTTISRRSSIRNHYCSCYPKSLPDSERVPSKYYCYRHRRHLCDNCIYDELNQRHSSCYVGTYESFIQSGPTAFSQYKKNKCPICDEVLPDDDARAVVRLNCTCVYHSNCLQKYLLENSTNEIPCIQCNLPIASTKSTKGSNLAKSVDNFLRSVTRQRLWNKPICKPVASKLKQSRSLLDEAEPESESNLSKSNDFNLNEEEEKTPLISSNIGINASGSRLSTTSSPYPKRKPIQRTMTKSTKPKRSPPSSSSRTKALSRSPVPTKPARAGHIVLDTEMTRHRTIASHRAVSHSMNPDMNRGDDKYHKPKRKGFVPNYVGGNRSNVRSWMTDKKIWVLLLVCLALMVQLYFVWLLFFKADGDEGMEGGVSGGNPINDPEMDALLGNQAKVKSIRDHVIG